MKEETLKKAKNLESDITEYTNLLRSRKADYYTMLIKISCSYANDHEDYHGRVDKQVWDKMLDVVEGERTKDRRKLAALTDDSEDGAEAEVTEEPTEKTTHDEEPKPKKKGIGFWRWLFYGVFVGLFLGALFSTRPSEAIRRVRMNGYVCQSCGERSLTPA